MRDRTHVCTCVSARVYMCARVCTTEIVLTDLLLPLTPTIPEWYEYAGEKGRTTGVPSTPGAPSQVTRVVES